VEVKIGVPDEIEAAVSEAIRSDLGVLSLTDDKGRRVLVPVGKLAYIEIAEAEGRRVGFGAAM
jgi:Protein of unknown function (DUF3107)